MSELVLGQNEFFRKKGRDEGTMGKMERSPLLSIY